MTTISTPDFVKPHCHLKYESNTQFKLKVVGLRFFDYQLINVTPLDGFGTETISLKIVLEKQIPPKKQTPVLFKTNTLDINLTTDENGDPVEKRIEVTLWEDILDNGDEDSLGTCIIEFEDADTSPLDDFSPHGYLRRVSTEDDKPHLFQTIVNVDNNSKFSISDWGFNNNVREYEKTLADLPNNSSPIVDSRLINLDEIESVSIKVKKGPNSKGKVKIRQQNADNINFPDDDFDNAS